MLDLTQRCTATDGINDPQFATATILVIPVDNSDPIAQDDEASTDEDTAVEVFALDNDSDPDSDPIAVIDATNGDHGTVVFLPTGLLYFPDANWHGIDSFTYTISDGFGGTDTATVSITVNPVNDAPDAVDDTASTASGSSAYIFVLSNDSDPELDPLSVSSYTQPSHGSVSFASGTATYTPTTGYSGSDSFTYTISDGHGGSDTATVNITVEAPIPPPPPSPPPPPGFSSVTGTIWDDADGDGVQDAGEAGFGTSVQVLLLDTNGNTVASTWTTAGAYSFGNIANGDYRIRVILPSGYQFSPPDQGDEDHDSDVDSDGYSGFFTVSGATSFDLDAGVEAI